MPIRKFLPPDTRPSKAHPEYRRKRKELEKEHGYGWVPPIILGLIGIGLAYDVTKDVERAEERKNKQEQEEQDLRRRGARGGGRRGRRSRSQGEEAGDDYDDDDCNEDDRVRDHRHRRGGSRRGETDGGDAYDDDHHGDDDGAAAYDNLDRAGQRDGGLRRADMLERGQGGLPEQRDHNRADRRHRRRARDEFASPPPPPAAAGYDYDYEDYGSYGYSRGKGGVMDDYSRRPRARRRSSDW